MQMKKLAVSLLPFGREGQTNRNLQNRIGAICSGIRRSDNSSPTNRFSKASYRDADNFYYAQEQKSIVAQIQYAPALLLSCLKVQGRYAT
mmetsp:Transcript_162/g.258  ORF Transcript_162/g.258 Transcript_162/m.258 type:complete len:90 (+) Transcript_162:306-575(+)